MTLSWLDNLLWAAGFLGHAALCAVLLARRGWREFPFFFGWIGFQLVRTGVLFSLHYIGRDHAYARVYWYGQVPELFLVLGIAWEIARHVLRPRGKWHLGAKVRFFSGSFFAFFTAILVTALLRPKVPGTFLEWFYPSNLFCSVLIFELALALLFTADSLVLAWRSRVFGLAQGWMLWSGLMFIAEGAHSYFPNFRFSNIFDKVRMFGYIAALGLWIVNFWRLEPEPRPLSPELRAALASSQTLLEGFKERLR